MREALRPLDGQRITITGRVAKFGCRPLGFNLYGETVCLEGVTGGDGQALTDHVWVNVGARMEALDIRKGDVLTLTARVRPYTKHQRVVWKNGKFKFTHATLDYKLTYPARIQRLAQGVQQ
jgi:hypothetical protein